jgi:hypothetical protein
VARAKPKADADAEANKGAKAEDEMARKCWADANNAVEAQRMAGKRQEGSSSITTRSELIQAQPLIPEQAKASENPDQMALYRADIAKWYRFILPNHNHE